MRKIGWIAVWFSALVLGAGATAQPVISSITPSVTTDGNEIVTLTANAPLTVGKRFVLTDPDRLVVDMQAMQGVAGEIPLPEGYTGKLISGVRFGRFSPTVSRLVIEIADPGVVASTTATKTGLIVSVAPTGSIKKEIPPPPPPKPKPKKKPSATSAVAIEEAKPLIVIDAGHGGQDPGAIGRNNTREKDVTLAVALDLKEALLRTGRYRVALTREDDRYILLPERVAIARKLKGDLFLSIHADSNPVASARGLSIYTLSETASDDEAQALAERENKSDIIGGLDLNTADQDVASILIDLTQRETADKSYILAEKIVSALHPKIYKLDPPHRFAGFRVLKAPDIPSVLIELGFLSNSTDERLLQRQEYRAMLVKSIIKGVDRYLGKKEK